MPDKLTPYVSPEPAELGVFAQRPDLQAEVMEYAKPVESTNTTRAHRADWSVFVAWCGAQAVPVRPLPASTETLLTYLADQAHTKSVATVGRYASTISVVHRLAGVANPYDARVRNQLKKMRRQRLVRQRQVAPLTADVIVRAFPEWPVTLRDQRDRALLLFGMSAGFRRSEICALNQNDLEWWPEGCTALIRKSKTDQEGKGHVVGIPYQEHDFCPARALRAWLNTVESDDTSAPLWYSVSFKDQLIERRITVKEIAAIVKRTAVRAGLDPNKYSGHSIRAGFVTDAREQNTPWEMIKEQTRHSKLETLEIYDRRVRNPFKASGVKGILEKAFAEAIARASRNSMPQLKG